VCREGGTKKGKKDALKAQEVESRGCSSKIIGAISHGPAGSENLWRRGDRLACLKRKGEAGGSSGGGAGVHENLSGVTDHQRGSKMTNGV